jgi:transcriptional regulator with XRE-family HTH domain
VDIREFLEGRIAAGETKSDIGRRVGVHPSYVTRWLSGSAPEPRQCRSIADSYGLPLTSVLAMAGHYEEVSGAADPEREVYRREIDAIFDSFDRSKWADLTATLKGVSSLVSPSPKDNAGGTPQRSRAEITLEEPHLEYTPKAVNSWRAKKEIPAVYDRVPVLA